MKTAYVLTLSDAQTTFETVGGKGHITAESNDVLTVQV